MSHRCHTLVREDVDGCVLDVLLVGKGLPQGFLYPGVLLDGQGLSQGFLYPDVLFSGGIVAHRIQTRRSYPQGPDSGCLVTYLSGASLRCDLMVLVEYCNVSHSILIHDATDQTWRMC